MAPAAHSEPILSSKLKAFSAGCADDIECSHMKNVQHDQNTGNPQFWECTEQSSAAARCLDYTLCFVSSVYLYGTDAEQDFGGSSPSER